MQPVLIVEDDLATREMVATCLELDGIPTVVAANGQEGLERLRESAPCLVLLDLMMPVMDGEEFRAAQLSDPQLATVPVIVLSAIHDLSARAAKMRAAAFIPKPFDVERVRDVVLRHCSAHLR